LTHQIKKLTHKIIELETQLKEAQLQAQVATKTTQKQAKLLATATQTQTEENIVQQKENIEKDQEATPEQERKFDYNPLLKGITEEVEKAVRINIVQKQQEKAAKEVVNDGILLYLSACADEFLSQKSDQNRPAWMAFAAVMAKKLRERSDLLGSIVNTPDFLFEFTAPEFMQAIDNLTLLITLPAGADLDAFQVKMTKLLLKHDDLVAQWEEIQTRFEQKVEAPIKIKVEKPEPLQTIQEMYTKQAKQKKQAEILKSYVEKKNKEPEKAPVKGIQKKK
jgi:hypothetical protein